MKGRNRTIFLLLTSQLAIICLFVCFGLAYYKICVIFKKIDNKLIILMLLEICCGFGFLLFVRLVIFTGSWIEILVIHLLSNSICHPTSSVRRRSLWNPDLQEADNDRAAGYERRQYSHLHQSFTFPARTNFMRKLLVFCLLYWINFQEYTD